MDYADGKFGQLDEAHVARWISQFDTEDQDVVLAETNRILKKAYFSKKFFTDFITGLVAQENFSTTNPNNYWSNTSFCNIQKNGQSQQQLLSIFQNAVLERFNLVPTVNSVSQNYIYLDDFIFSGNRLITDMRSWIVEHAPNECSVRIVVIGWYQSAYWYIVNELPKIAQSVNKNITFEYWSNTNARLENRLKYRNDSHVFWPEQSVLTIPTASQYISQQTKLPIFRVHNGIKNTIFSRNRRTQYENAMIKAGIKIISFCNDTSPVMKPLGYNRFEGFGFGSTIFTYRNCPNNNPLAFWWGDPKASRFHPFSKWYPLMQRTTYGS